MRGGAGWAHSLAYIPLYRRGGVRMRLLKGAPGADVGGYCHDHRGQEYTLVLAGGYSDQTGSYGPGDFQTAAPEEFSSTIPWPTRKGPASISPSRWRRCASKAWCRNSPPSCSAFEKYGNGPLTHQS